MLIFLIFFGSNVLVVRIYNYCIDHTTIANLLVVLLNISWYLWHFPECFFRNLKKYFSTSVFTFWWKENCTIWYFWSGSSFYSMTPILLNSIWCLIVKRSTFAENIFIARINGNPFLYRFWNLLQYRRSMIWTCINW